MHSQVELEKLARACQTPMERLVIYSLIDTPLRPSEICKIHLYPRREGVLLLTRKKTTGGFSRTRIPLTPRLEKALGELDPGLLTLDLIWEVTARVARRAGVYATPHTLHH